MAKKTKIFNLNCSTYHYEKLDLCFTDRARNDFLLKDKVICWATGQFLKGTEFFQFKCMETCQKHPKNYYYDYDFIINLWDLN